MKKCECGHTHCCHGNRKREEMQTEENKGHLIKFIRETCRDCKKWLSDELKR